MQTAAFLFCAMVMLSCAALPTLGAEQPALTSPSPASPERTNPPTWAYPASPPTQPISAMPDSTPRHVPGSPLAFSHAQTTDRFFAPDWHPEEHGPMPEVVSHGRKPGVFACAYCHLPNGAGRSENASLAGLPESYILEQISAMKSGRRRGSLPAMTGLMTVVARGVTDEDAKSAAHYFSALAPRAGWIRVFETDVVPTTHVIPVNVLAPVGDGKQEAIGNRIIEVPEDVDRTGLRDSAAGYVAYAPRGSVSRGKMLVTTGGGGTTIPCASCHGANLRGAAAIPSIAGRSPSYIFRQLSDIKAGTREGQEVALMKAPVAALSEDDMICIAAYLATLSN